MDKVKVGLRKTVGVVTTAAILCGSITALNVVQASANEYVSVELNGTELDFNDAKPQIYNNRTYVPVRQVAENFGFDIDWDAENKTFTFTRDDVEIKHELGTNLLYVNGEAKSFDTPSINRDNRTLMPVRMLAEAVGADVEWDSDERKVIVNENNVGSFVSDAFKQGIQKKIEDKFQNNTETYLDFSDSEDTNLVVKSVEASADSVDSGANVCFTAVASGETQKVFFCDGNGKKIAEVSEFTENSDGTRTFSCTYRVVNPTSEECQMQIKAYPGNGKSYNRSKNSVNSVSVNVGKGKLVNKQGEPKLDGDVVLGDDINEDLEGLQTIGDNKQNANGKNNLQKQSQLGKGNKPSTDDDDEDSVGSNKNNKAPKKTMDDDEDFGSSKKNNKNSNKFTDDDEDFVGSKNNSKPTNKFYEDDDEDDDEDWDEDFDEDWDDDFDDDFDEDDGKWDIEEGEWEDYAGF
jgi:hypothetical protein